MIRLVPEWAYHYDEFWTAIKRRNLWFIKLRYYFVALLAIFYLGGEYILGFNLTVTQKYAVIIVTVTILIYNLIIHDFKNHINSEPGKFNHMHLSLVQMVLDLSALMILVYFTGIIESPLYKFFIFQMVVGSLILPGYIVYSIGSIVIIIYGVLIALQHVGAIETHLISGLYVNYTQHTFSYSIIFFIMFSALMLISVLLTNTIAIRLYQREKQLWETLEKLSNAEKAKQKYIIGIVHEIKTPIAAVQSLLDVIINKYVGPVSDVIMDKLNRARTRSSEAVRLINNVLHISKIKLLDIKVMDELHIPKILKDTINKFSDWATSRNITISFIDTRENDLIIHGDNLLFELCFSNIINNAIKYNLTNGRVNITLFDRENHLHIVFEDDGIGIPEKEQITIFNQFFRASNIKGQDIEGSGLGLSLVNEVVNRYNGRIEVKSPSGIGTPERPGTGIILRFPYPNKEIKEKPLIKKKVAIHDQI